MDLTDTQVRAMGLDPNETSSPQQGPDGQWYKLDNNGRGGRYVNVVPAPSTSGMSVPSTSGGGGGSVPQSPFTTDWWTKARQEAFSSLTPYYEQKLKDAKGDVDLAKRLIEEDYRIGNRYRTEDLEIEKGDVERAKQRLADDFSRTERTGTEDLASQMATFGLESAEERRNTIAQANLRGTLFGEIEGQGARAPYSQYAKEYILNPMEEKQALRRQAIERAIQRQSEVAGFEKTRGTEDVASQFRRFQLGQTRGEQEAKLGREKGLSEAEISLRDEQDRLKREQEERAYGQIVPRRYESEYSAFRAANKLG